MSDLFESARNELGQLSLRLAAENSPLRTADAGPPRTDIAGIEAQIEAIAGELAEARGATRYLIDLANRLIDANQRLRQVVESRRVGRPLKAGPAEVKRAQALRRAGHSLRAISAETGLSLRTVRTIVDRAKGDAAPAAAPGVAGEPVRKRA